MQGPAVALGEVKPPGRFLCPATPISFLSVGSGRPQFLTVSVRLCLPVLSSVFLLASSSFSFTLVFFFLLVFDVRVFIDFHCMAHIPFIYLHKPLRYFLMLFMCLHILYIYLPMPFTHPHKPLRYFNIPFMYHHNTVYIPS